MGVVTFKDGCFVVNYGSGTRQALFDAQDGTITILGNRFENPELLIGITTPKKNENAQEVEIQILKQLF